MPHRDDALLDLARGIIEHPNGVDQLQQMNSYRALEPYLLLVLQEKDSQNTEAQMTHFLAAWIAAKLRQFGRPLAQRGARCLQDVTKRATLRELFELLHDQEKAKSGTRAFAEAVAEIERDWAKLREIRVVFESVFNRKPRSVPPVVRAQCRGRPIGTISTPSTSPPPPVSHMPSENSCRTEGLREFLRLVGAADHRGIAAFVATQTPAAMTYFVHHARVHPELLKCVGGRGASDEAKAVTVVALLRLSQRFAPPVSQAPTWKCPRGAAQSLWAHLRSAISSGSLENVLRAVASVPWTEFVAQCFRGDPAASSPSVPIVGLLAAAWRGHCSYHVEYLSRLFVRALLPETLGQWRATFADLSDVLRLPVDCQQHLLSLSPALLDQAERDPDRCLPALTWWLRIAWPVVLAAPRPPELRRAFACVVVRHHVRHATVASAKRQIDAIRRVLDHFSPSEQQTIAKDMRRQADAFEEVARVPALRVFVRRLMFPDESPGSHAAVARDALWQARAEDVDLRYIASVEDSAMRALTQVERSRLRALTERYAPADTPPDIVAAALDELRCYIAERYARAPARLFVEETGHSYALPLTWDAYLETLFGVIAPAVEEQLRLAGRGASVETYTVQRALNGRAMHCYYQHSLHTAWRYLQRPNAWSARVDAMRRGEGSANCERYAREITALFLAAADETMTPTDGRVSVADRVDLFCAELAAINRARNFDETRERVEADGRRRIEQFDDLRGDAPSCASGQLKCLAQSLLFYPFDVLSVAPLSLDPTAVDTALAADDVGDD